MSVKSSQFNYELNQYSPVIDEYNAVVKCDEEGKQEIVYEKADLASVVKSHGNSEDWKLDKLFKAGINPDFPIHTSAPSRVESASDVLEVEKEVNALFENVESEKSE